MSQTQALYRLQQIDSGIDSRRRRYRELSVALENSSVLQNARDHASAAETELRPQEARAKNLNLEIKSTVTQTEQLSQRLYGGSVSNPKELEDMQDKLAALKRQRDKLEDDLLETMIRVEELQAAYTTAQDQLNAIESTWESDHADMIAERKQIKQEARQLKQEREAAAAAIDAENMALYEELRRTKNGVAVALMEGEACAACNVDQTSNVVQIVRQRKEIAQCGTCGRILVAH